MQLADFCGAKDPAPHTAQLTSHDAAARPAGQSPQLMLSVVTMPAAQQEQEVAPDPEIRPLAHCVQAQDCVVQPVEEEMKVPAPHGDRHVDCPVLGCQVPAEHGTAAAAPPVHRLPMLQGAHAHDCVEQPIATVGAAPAGHVLGHEDWPVFGCQVPAEHGTWAAAPPGQRDPLWQVSQAQLALAHAFTPVLFMPAGHGRQLVPPTVG